jgi:hypothetical protein
MEGKKKVSTRISSPNLLGHQRIKDSIIFIRLLQPRAHLAVSTVQ